ncbi:Pentatricopeptide repeat-containing protein [Diplonema papillatum]|nr:Pentatricopeptide repeat-containing protein [Diplonema papillatum]
MLALRPTCVLYVAAAPLARRRRDEPSKHELELFRTVLTGALRCDYSTAVASALRATISSSRYKGVEKLSARGIKVLLSLEGTPPLRTIVPALCELVTRVTSQPCVLDEEAVLAILYRALIQVKAAKRVDLMCVVGSRTHQLLTDMYRLFKWLQAEGHTITTKCWTLLVQAASASRFSTLVRHLLREMQKEGFRPDVYVAAAALGSFKASANAKPEVVDGLRRDCVKLWLDLKADGVFPDAYCYSTMIAVLNSFGDNVHAEQIFAEMKAEGFQPASETYTSLITGVTTEDRLHGIVREMAERGLTVDARCFAAIIRATRVLNPGDCAKAEAVFRTAVEENVALDEWVCCAMLLVYRDAGSVRRAASFMKRMIDELRVRPTFKSANIVLETASLACKKHGDDGHKTAVWAWRYCTAQKAYTHHSFGFIMKAMLAAGEHEYIKSLFSLLKSTRLPVTLVHLEYLVAAHRKLGDDAAAAAVLRSPLYAKLGKNKAAMQEGRKRNTAHSFTGFTPGLTAAPTAEEMRAAAPKSQASLKTVAPSTSPPHKRLDSVGLQLAHLVDTLEQKPRTVQKQPTQYALDDVLGL